MLRLARPSFSAAGRERSSEFASLDPSLRRYGLILRGFEAADADMWRGIAAQDSSMVVLGVSERLKVKAPPSATGLSGLASDDEAEWPRLCRRAWPECACALALTMVVVLALAVLPEHVRCKYEERVVEGNVARASITKQPPYQPVVTPRRDRIGDETTTTPAALDKRVASR